VANGNAAPNAAPGAPGNGIAFQAQFGIGPLGLDIGVGGPGMMQNFLDRINQQNQGNQQPAAAAPVQPGQQQDQQQPNPNSAASEIQQHIIRTRQLIERETAMLELSRRQLQQLQLLQAHQDAVNLNAGNAASAVPPLAQPIPTEVPPASGATNEGNAPPIAQPANAPGSASSSTAPFAPPSLGTPQDVILPPGWSVIPLTVFAPDRSSGLAMPSLLSPTALASRRNHRTYQENMRNYHSLRTPTEYSFHDVELGHRFRRPGVGHTTSAPAGPRERGIILTDTSRLTPAQRASLDRPTRECVIALSLFLDQHYVEGRREYVNTLLLGLPEEIRTEILTGWPDQQLAQQIGGNVAIMSQMNASEEVVSSAREVALRGVASMVAGLDRIERLRVLLGLPVPFRNSVMDRTEESDALRLGVEELRATYSCTELPELPEVAPLPEQPTPEELSRVDQETREAVSQRITALNDTAQRMREAAASLERTAATSPFFVPTPSSFADGTGGEERLRMFGEASMFPLPAQERTLRRLEEELVNKEKEFKAGKVIEGLLNGGGTGSARARDDERKEEEWTDVQSAAPMAEGKGKNVERGEGSENM
jgi:E3 ubiquitin-protein ligase synoviolin